MNAKEKINELRASATRLATSLGRSNSFIEEANTIEILTILTEIERLEKFE